MHELDQPLQRLGRRAWQNAVAEIEDVARSASGALQNILGFGLHNVPGRSEYCRIEVALNRYTI